MSAEVAVRAAVIDALRGDVALMDGINALFDGEPARASLPYGVVGECIGADWGGKALDGRELRLTIALYDGGETIARLAGMIGRVDPVLTQAAPREGWRIVTARLVRSRVGRADGNGVTGARWRAVIDYRIRAVREG